MRLHGSFFVSLAILAAPVAPWSGASQAGVIESFWISESGGNFEDPANWSGPVPDETVTAIFAIDTGQGIGPFVTFNAGELSHRVIVRDGNPYFVMWDSDKAGEMFEHTYHVADEQTIDTRKAGASIRSLWSVGQARVPSLPGTSRPVR